MSVRAVVCWERRAHRLHQRRGEDIVPLAAYVGRRSVDGRGGQPGCGGYRQLGVQPREREATPLLRRLDDVRLQCAAEARVGGLAGRQVGQQRRARLRVAARCLQRLGRLAELADQYVLG